ncbi:MAG TPA: hypothetical protein VFD27_03720, partial [Chthoniobacteraceae bacterium]|nr:hypothetical protein [Chthoniobacteraceae bacterium]
MEGSSRINCRYVWRPPAEELPLLHAVFEYNNYIYGGVEFKTAEEIFPGNSGADPNDDLMRKTVGDFGHALWCRAAVFLEVCNGDCLGLDIESNAADPPVAYLLHDGEESNYISRSFSEFLASWSELSFIGPEFWLLDYWADPETGMIDPRNYKTDELRSLLSPRGQQNAA